MTIMKGLRLPALASRLSSACDFVQVATQVCVLAAELGVDQCTVSLHASSGRPALCVDNRRAITREERVDYFAEHWVSDPVLVGLRESHAPIGVENELAIPLLEPGALIGSIRFWHREAIAAEVRRDLCALGTHVSVRLAQLQITAPPEADPFSRLTPRQVGVALLAARGSTNGEIAGALELSENTVKKHLKDVFERMSISNRTELAVVIVRASVPQDVTEHDGVTVMRARAA